MYDHACYRLHRLAGARGLQQIVSIQMGTNFGTTQLQDVIENQTISNIAEASPHYHQLVTSFMSHTSLIFSDNVCCAKDDAHLLAPAHHALLRSKTKCPVCCVLPRMKMKISRMTFCTLVAFSLLQPPCKAEQYEQSISAASFNCSAYLSDKEKANLINTYW